MNPSPKKKGFFYWIERGGNALPHPGILFGLLALTVLVLSLIGSLLGWHSIHPITEEDVTVVNLLSREGLHRILLEMVDNYTSFAPLGIVMVALLGLGVAESSGLIKSAVNALLVKTPPFAITFMVVFTGVLSNIASDLGYLLVIPLAGVIFHSLGRHPIAGLSAAFAGVSGGFSANLLIGTTDPLLAGLSTEAAHFIDMDYYVTPTANYYFMAVSTILVSFIGTLVTDKWIEPRLGKYKGDVPKEEIIQPTTLERKGLRNTGWFTLGIFALVAALLIPENGLLRGNDGSILTTPILKGFIAFLFIYSVAAGAIFGFTAGVYKKSGDVIKGMTESFKSIVPFLVLVFFAAQFVAWFRWSNLGLLVAVNGANALQNANLDLIPLAILFVLFSALLNMFMGSASAKWALIGPVFIPIFMILGYSPELSQAIFRIGDSVTNIISPMMSFFALIIVYYQKYDEKSGIGTLMACMLPYTIALLIGWILLLIGWILLGLPLGPGAPLRL